MNFSAIMGLPIFENSVFQNEAICRLLLLNCLTRDYEQLWKTGYNDAFRGFTWAKQDQRLSDSIYRSITPEWRRDGILRSDYSRRQALVEIDVLTAMSMGMNLSELKTIYSIQFPVLRKNEEDTWYDAAGRIVFTCSTILSNVGFDRKTWENGIKGAPAGQKFYRTITDDTMPGGPVERTIQYVAPFDRCDREQDYETAWKFFEEKYGKQG